MKTLKEINEDTITADLTDLISRFESSLPTRVDPAGLTLKSKIPFKALSLRELLFHRITMISRTAFNLYLDNKRVPSYILMRSAVETASLCYYIAKKIQLFVDNPNVDELDDLLVKGIAGGRDEKSEHESVNILTCVDHVDREFQDFRKQYDVLCEYAHPNYLGTLDAFGKVDRDNVWLDLGAELKMPPAPFGLIPFFFSLLIFEEQYDKLADCIDDINDYFEKNSA